MAHVRGGKVFCPFDLHRALMDARMVD